MAEVKVGDLLECEDASCAGCRAKALVSAGEGWGVSGVTHCSRGYDKTETGCYFRKWHKVEDKGLTGSNFIIDPDVVGTGKSFVDVAAETYGFTVAQLQKFADWRSRKDKGQSPTERTVEMSEERLVEFAIVERSVDEDGSKHMRMLLPEKDDDPMPRIKTAAEGEKLVRLLLVKYHSDVLKANCVENVDVILVPFGGPG